MRCGVVVCAVAAGVLVLAGCGGGGKATPSTAPSVAVTTPAPPAAVKLSAKWGPKLDALDAKDGTAACQNAGSSACATAISETLSELNAFMDDVNAGGAGRYPASIAQVQKMLTAAQGYSSAGCEGGTAASCYPDALAVTVGVPTLGMTMTTDELKAGG